MRAAARHLAIRTALLLTTAACGATAVSAQTASPAPPSTTSDQQVGAPGAAAAGETANQDEATRGGLQDVVVTARRRQENLQNIPVADQVISSAQVANYGITSIEKVSTLAPQLIVGRNGTGNGAAIGLRGISVNATSISLEQSVATVIDGVYYSGGRALNIGLFDVAQVELLKGPQSLFYGKNTTAGALSIGTADPTSELHAMLRTGYETRAEQTYTEGFISGPITDKLSVRVAARYSKQYGSLIDNVGYPVTTYTRDIATGIVTPHLTPTGQPNLPGEKTDTFRLALKYDSGNGLTAVWKNTYNYYHTNAANSASVIGNCESGFVQSDPTAPCGHKFKVVSDAIPADIAAVNPWENRHGGDNYLDYYMFNSTLNMTYDAGKVIFSLVPAYTTYTDYWVTDSDFTNLYLNHAPALGTGGNNAATREQQRATSVEFRAQTHLERLNFMVGGYYQHSNLTFGQENLFPGGVENSAVTDPSLRYLTIRKRGFTKGNTYSGFGQILFDITPNLNITGGVRYSHETKSSIFAQPYVFPGSLASYAITQIGADQTFNNTSPEATITWKPDANVTVYGSFRTGYKSGGFSISGTISPTTTPADAAFGPETVRGFEGGVKTTLFDRQVRLNIDAFRYRYSGLQVDFLNTITVQYLTLNAASARSQGVELEAEFAPNAVPGLHLRGSAAYTDAFYIDFPLAPCVGGQTPAEGCNLAINAAGAGTRQNLGGQRTPQAPKFAGTLGLDYERPVGDRYKIGYSGNLRYSSRYKTYAFAPDAASRFYQESYATLDASLRFGAANDRWEFSVIGKNLTNHFVQSSAFDLTYTGARTGLPTGLHADTRSTIYDPRTVALQATVRF